MKRVTILTAVMATMVAGGAMAQNNSTAGFRPLIVPSEVPACQEEVRLNRYKLIAWGGYVPDRYVGGFRASTDARLVELKDDYVAACADDGAEMMAATKKQLQDEYNHQMANIDNFWGAWARRWIDDKHNADVEAMTKFYRALISSCQQHFTNEYNALSGQLCR